MTQSFSRLLAFPFIITLILALANSQFDYSGPMTIVVLACLLVLCLLFVFKDQVDQWWWKRRPPNLDTPVKAWMKRFSPYYNRLDDATRSRFEPAISIFMRTKEFTLKADRDFQLEEDIKGIIAHEFVRVGITQGEHTYDNLDHLVLYNHPFGSPDVQQLHSLELNREDGVVIMSKELAVNGFIQPATYVNISLLGAIMTFIWHHPRLAYPSVSELTAEDIAQAHKVDLQVILQTLGVDHINKLDLLVFCFFLYPDRTKDMDEEVHTGLMDLFGKGLIPEAIEEAKVEKHISTSAHQHISTLAH